MPTLIAACRACSQATRVAGLRRWAMSISSTSEKLWLGSMSAGNGNWTAVFSGTANRLAATAAGAGGVGASLDGSNCHGVSGDAGAKSLVSLQAPRRTHPAKALRRNLAGGMQCISDRRRGHRSRLRTNLVENVADVLVQQAIPCDERHQVITSAGQDWRFRQVGYHLARSLTAARPRGGLPKPSRQRLVMRTNCILRWLGKLVPARICTQIENRQDRNKE